MSKNRENVTWQTVDGTWGNGHYAVFPGNIDDDDYDDEWDVDYDFSAFYWASTGHPTPEAAEAAWHGANPGAARHVARTGDDVALCDQLDAMAAVLKAEEVAERAARKNRPVRW